MDRFILIAASLLLLLSVCVSKISDRFGIPALLLFLGIGMLAGSDGIGGIYFDNPAYAQAIGVVALVLILFSGGMDTAWKQIRPVLKEGLLLATIGVVATAAVIGLVASQLFHFPLKEGLLLGAIVSSTDAAAVFSVLRSSGIKLKGQLQPLLELESGSNDPMAIFLTLGLIQLINQPDLPLINLLGLFGLQMGVGSALGYGMGRLIVLLINSLKLGYEGLYPVLTLSLVFLTFGMTDLLGGSGFLAVYIAGIIVGNRPCIYKRNLLQFYDGLAWLMQILVFLTLGLLVFPSRLLPIAGTSLLLAIALIFVARPLSVFLALWPTHLNWREKTLIAWVGLRGAVPIIMATFPLMAGIPNAESIFNIIFFVVMTSVLCQGTSIPLVAKWLGLKAPAQPKRLYPLDFTPMANLKRDLQELLVPAHSPMVDKAIGELGLPDSFFILLIARGDSFIVPRGSTVVHGGDTLLALADQEATVAVQAQFALTHQA